MAQVIDARPKHYFSRGVDMMQAAPGVIPIESANGRASSPPMLPSAGVFGPVYVLTIVLAPQYNRFKHNRRVRAFIDGATAAATGAIAGAAIVLGRRAITDVYTLVIALGALLAVTRSRRVPDPLVILAAGVVGIVARGTGV